MVTGSNVSLLRGTLGSTLFGNGFAVPKSNTEKCVVCLQIMDNGDSAKLSVYKLIHRPEDAYPPGTRLWRNQSRKRMDGTVERRH